MLLQKGTGIKSSQQDPLDREELLINREATSMRQSTKWGMRSLQESFPRLKDRFQYEEEVDDEDYALVIQLQSEEGWYNSNTKCIHAVTK